MGTHLRTMVVEEAGMGTSILIKDLPCMATHPTTRLTIKVRVICLATLRISPTLRTVIPVAHIEGAVATLTMVLIADRQDLVLIRPSAKVEGVAV